MDEPQLRDYLVAARKATGWTQEELAERSGVSVRTIRNLETGAIALPRRTSVDLLVTALGTTAPRQAGPPGGPLAWLEPLLRRAPQAPMLPVPPRRAGDAVIGRDRELHALAGALRWSQVTVLTGPGGVGKTRLAEEFARVSKADFGQGTAVAELGRLPAGAADERRVWQAIEAVLPDPDGARGDFLLVVDNAEHVLAHLARPLSRVVAELARVRVLVTSRRPLQIPAASVLEVRPLPVEPAGPGRHGAAVELFVRRAEASCLEVPFDPGSDAVRRLCRRLEGIPYALELAAARARTVPLETLLRGEPLSRLLGHAAGAALPHQRSLDDSVRWSWELLGEEQRAALGALSRLAGPFSLEEAEAAAGRGLTGALGDLVDASLVEVRRGARYSYRVMRHVREYLASLSDQPAARSSQKERATRPGR